MQTTARKIYLADRIFTGEKWLNDHSVIVEDGIIHSVVPYSSLKNTEDIERFDDCIIVPAFIDLQIYGAYGKLLAVFPETESLNKLVEYCNKGGAVFCLPTVATNTKEVFYKCIDAIKSYWEKGGKGVLGLHIEGPWINSEKRGAHIKELIHFPSLKEVIELLEYGKGVIKMITLAPEVCDKEIIELILSYNIVISAGHSNATYEQAMQGFENGITAVTHLYNAMSPLQHRQPGLVGATLDQPSVIASIIPDGYHVSYSAIRIAKKIMGERLFAITDAVTETKKGYYHHHLAADKYEAAGILSGSALTMNKALQNLMNHAGIELDEALRMCSTYPAKLMKLDNRYGHLEKNYSANIAVLDKRLNLIKLIYN
jgi:N-acetylglucosamine-6-phosphate deacetylase